MSATSETGESLTAALATFEVSQEFLYSIGHTIVERSGHTSTKEGDQTYPLRLEAEHGERTDHEGRVLRHTSSLSLKPTGQANVLARIDAEADGDYSAGNITYAFYDLGGVQRRVEEGEELPLLSLVEPSHFLVPLKMWAENPNALQAETQEVKLSGTGIKMDIPKSLAGSINKIAHARQLAEAAADIARKERNPYTQTELFERFRWDYYFRLARSAVLKHTAAEGYKAENIGVSIEYFSPHVEFMVEQDVLPEPADDAVSCRVLLAEYNEPREQEVELYGGQPRVLASERFKRMLSSRTSHVTPKPRLPDTNVRSLDVVNRVLAEMSVSHSRQELTDLI